MHSLENKRFTPYETMFKLPEPDSLVVECVNCAAMYPVKDLLSGELEETHCPACNEMASLYWKNMKRRPVPLDGFEVDE